MEKLQTVANLITFYWKHRPLETFFRLRAVNRKLNRIMQNSDKWLMLPVSLNKLFGQYMVNKSMQVQLQTNLQSNFHFISKRASMHFKQSWQAASLSVFVRDAKFWYELNFSWHKTLTISCKNDSIAVK